MKGSDVDLAIFTPNFVREQQNHTQKLEIPDLNNISVDVRNATMITK